MRDKPPTRWAWENNLLLPIPFSKESLYANFIGMNTSSRHQKVDIGPEHFHAFKYTVLRNVIKEMYYIEID